MLHGLRAGALADGGERHFARLAIERRRTDLDQLVVGERAVDLRDHGVGEALLADLQDGVERVGARLELLALRGREGGHAASIRSGAHGQIEQSLAAPPRHRRLRPPGESGGYRSRAAYKLLEIDRRDRIFRPG
jgi:hypothetical protein